MKKNVVFAFVAFLLGIGTMLAPFALFASELRLNKIDRQAEWSYPPTFEYMQKAPSETEQTYGIRPAAYPAQISIIALMFVASYVIAFGVKRHFTRKTIS